MAATTPAHRRKQQQVEGSCGLKNSGCPPTLSPSPTIWDEFNNFDFENDAPIIYRPFEFVHGIGLERGLWSLPTQYLKQKVNKSITPYKDIHCPVGGYAVFYFDAYWHDVIELTTHYTPTNGENATNGSGSSIEPFSSNFPESVCDLLSDGTSRMRRRRRRRRVMEDGNSSSSSSSSTSTEESYFLTYYHQCTKPGTTSILTCTTPGHCQSGQYVKVHTSSTIVATHELVYLLESVDEEGEEEATTGSDDDDHSTTLSSSLSSIEANNSTNSTAPIVHGTTSLEYIYRLLGRRVDTDTGWIIMDRGYETDLNANITMELIKEALEHCPIPEYDNDVDGGNVVVQAEVNSTSSRKKVECRSILYTLLGYIQRQQPTPNFTLSEQYYRDALEAIDDYYRDEEVYAEKDRNSTLLLLLSSHWCATQSYLVQLYLQQLNWCMAEKEWKVLCRTCGEHETIMGPVLKYYREKSQLAEEENNEEFLDWSRRFFIQPGNVDGEGEMVGGGCPETFWPTMTPTVSLLPTDFPTFDEQTIVATTATSFGAATSQRLGKRLQQHQGHSTFVRLELILLVLCSWWWLR